MIVALPVGVAVRVCEPEPSATSPVLLATAFGPIATLSVPSAWLSVAVEFAWKYLLRSPSPVWPRSMIFHGFGAQARTSLTLGERRGWGGYQIGFPTFAPDHGERSAKDAATHKIRTDRHDLVCHRCATGGRSV
ncbi:hypothetical protein BN2476_300078 [Paraburkholderia piptadeniae]|uniref:Uncharacterized protein n=1 Tax=Paraburkholderia piptadeniae TaxID=1701573 RepID=A0A1N7S2L6_9BURK|nr:hypothetical protein BN2476_300078 [Paraburkholderia piptadeniae]